MRRNNTTKSSNTISNFNKVYADIPQCPWMHSVVVMPLKTIYYNVSADPDAHIDRLIRTVPDLENFIMRYGVVFL